MTREVLSLERNVMSYVRSFYFNNFDHYKIVRIFVGIDDFVQSKVGTFLVNTNSWKKLEVRTLICIISTISLFHF